MSNSTSSGLIGLFVDVSTLPDNGYGFFQLIFLTSVYAYILFLGANLISDGSELLLLVPSLSGIVGSIVLPVLGAVPDGAIVLFSGLGPDPQYQLQVGIGALAGSTIMLLTIPWSIIIIAGRVDIHPVTGKLQYKSPKLSPPDRFDLFYTGVIVENAAKTTAYLVLLTMISYILIESAALAFVNDTDDAIVVYEYPYAVATFVIATAFLIFYVTWAYVTSDSDDAQKERDEYLTEGIKKGTITLVGVVEAVLETTESSAYSVHSSETDSLVKGDDKVTTRLTGVLKPFFEKYDKDKSKSISVDELSLLLSDLGENLRPNMVKEHFLAADKDHSGSLDYDEFVAFSLKYAKEHPSIVAAHAAETLKVKEKLESLDEGEGDEEEEEIPEDLISLSYEDQQFNIKMRAAWMLLLGTVVVLIFSDAIVYCLSAIGERIGVRPFYVSFVLAPFVSNGSELVAAYNYASKKTARSMGISMATLLGAAIMNNTLVLAIFMLLIFARSLYYEYFAETVAIIFVEVVVALYTILKDSHTVFDAFTILALYPLSLVIVYGLFLIGWG